MQHNVQRTDDWKVPFYAIGAVIGLVLGFLAAHMYTQAVDENHGGVMPKVETQDAFKLGLAGVALLRQITDLAAKGNSKR